MQPRHQYGGQAIIEGVMIRGLRHAVVSVRVPSGEISTRRIDVPGWAGGRMRSIPYLRGIVVLLETLIVGMRALSLSAALAIEEEPGSDQDAEGLGTFSMAIMLVFALALGVGLFFLMPLFASKGLESAGLSAVGANAVEGLLRLGAFLAYVWLIGRLSEIQRVLAYHGAEHMVVSAHDRGEPLTIESARRHSTAHPRCGTAFLLTVIVVSIVLFMFIPREPLALVVSSRILLIPVIAAVSYEFIRFAGRHPGNRLVRLLVTPSLLLQKLTTRPPDDTQIEVALEALHEAVRIDEAALEPGPAAGGGASGNSR